MKEDITEFVEEGSEEISEEEYPPNLNIGIVRKIKNKTTRESRIEKDSADRKALFIKLLSEL